jgi:hypothetical protein
MYKPKRLGIHDVSTKHRRLTVWLYPRDYGLAEVESQNLLRMLSQSNACFANINIQFCRALEGENISIFIIILTLTDPSVACFRPRTA